MLVDSSNGEVPLISAIPYSLPNPRIALNDDEPTRPHRPSIINLTVVGSNLTRGPFVSPQIPTPAYDHKRRFALLLGVRAGLTDDDKPRQWMLWRSFCLLFQAYAEMPQPVECRPVPQKAAHLPRPTVPFRHCTHCRGS